MTERPPLRLGVDIGAAVALTAVSLVSLPFVDQSTERDTAVDPLAVVLVVVAGLATTVRTWWPGPVLVATGGATAAYLALGYPYGPIYVSFALAVYAVGRRLPLTRAALWGVVALVASLLHVFAFTHPAAIPLPGALAPAIAWMLVPFTIGVARRMVLEARARERSEAERRLIETERLRLAQEVHDVVGHGLAAIQMQADIALHVGANRPEQATDALRAISRASDEALTELRTTLARIAPDQEPTRAPTASLTNLDGLRERVQAAGIALDLTVTGERRTLPSATDLAAYRVLQEALTNVVKHAHRRAATVRVDHHADRVELLVENDQPAATSYVEGFGISGMRRRVEQAGGRLTVGPTTRADRGAIFEVRAMLPREEDDQ